LTREMKYFFSLLAFELLGSASCTLENSTSVQKWLSDSEIEPIVEDISSVNCENVKNIAATALQLGAIVSGAFVSPVAVALVPILGGLSKLGKAYRCPEGVKNEERDMIRIAIKTYKESRLKNAIELAESVAKHMEKYEQAGTLKNNVHNLISDTLDVLDAADDAEQIGMLVYLEQFQLLAGLYTTQILQATSVEECDKTIVDLKHRIGNALSFYGREEKEWNPSQFDKKLQCQDNVAWYGICPNGYYLGCAIDDPAFSEKARNIKNCGGRVVCSWNLQWLRDTCRNPRTDPIKKGWNKRYAEWTGKVSVLVDKVKEMDRTAEDLFDKCGVLNPTLPLMNVALGGKARQSSNLVKYGHGADEAVDGVEQVGGVAHGFAHTELENNPWWSVEFGHKYAIKYVTVWNRYGCCEKRLNDAIVELLDGEEVVKKKVAHGEFGRVRVFMMEEKGTSLRVRLEKRESLVLTEVEVWGTPL